MKETIARYRRGLFVTGLLLSDAAVIVLALYAADYVRFHLLPAGGQPLPHLPHDLILPPALLAVLAILPVLWVVGLYEMRRGWGGLDLLFSTAVASALGVMGFLALSYLLKIFWYSRLMVWIFGGIVWIGLVALRLIIKPILLWLFRNGFGVLRLVIVGDSPVARSLASRIRSNPHSGLRVVGHLLVSDSAVGPGAAPGDRLEAAFEHLQNARPHICLFAESIHEREEMSVLLARCQEEGIDVWLATDLHQRFSPRTELKEVLAVPVIAVGRLRLATWESLLKRSLDIVGAIALLILAAPFMLYAAFRVRREIGGPVIFRQKRVGFQGRPFTIFKLRAAPAATESSKGGGSPPRATPFCDFLRAYSLDEIPQLWNVLRGEMSLVGPRPETSERVRRYNPWNRRRLHVKPGITGLAQIAGVRGEHDFDVKSRFDLRYAESQSLLFDLQILLRTPLVIWRRRSGRRGTTAAPVGVIEPSRATATADVAVAAPGTAPQKHAAQALPRMGRYRPPRAGRDRAGSGEGRIEC